MARVAVMALLFWGTILSAQTKPSDTIDAIDFYGYQGLDLASVRATLPVRVGSALTKQTRPMIETAVAEASVHNFSPSPRDVTFAVSVGDEANCDLINLLSDQHSQPSANGKHCILLEPYGYRWYRVGGLDYLLRRTEV